MMSEASFASLGPTLLARKGGAKPAMRPQLTPLPEDLSALAALADEQLEDLGWNDMGADREFDRISERGVDRGTGRDAPLLSIKPGAKSALRAVEETGSFSADPGCEAGDKTADSPVALEDTADTADAAYQADIVVNGPTPAPRKRPCNRPPRRPFTTSASVSKIASPPRRRQAGQHFGQAPRRPAGRPSRCALTPNATSSCASPRPCTG